MRKIIFSFLGVFLSTSAFSQIETNYYFDSAENRISSFLLNENAPTYNMEFFDSQKISNEEINSPCKFAKGYDVSISLDDGIWRTCDEGRTWSIKIQSVNANSLTLSFNDLKLSENGYLYIMNEDQTVLYGPVSTGNTPNNGRFLTDVIPGNEIRICIFEPASAFGITSMKIDKVYCGYKNIGYQMGTRGCDNDIACDSNFQMESFGIANIVYSFYSDLFYSTGFLVMTTDLSFKPYLQTAYHTIDLNEDGYFSDTEKAAVQNGVFKFNYKYTTCGGSTLASTYTYNGATVRAYYSSTDFALLELGSSVSNNSALTWLGWDRGSSIPTSGTGLHYPLGNPMKISYEYDSFSTCDFNSSGVYNHWLVNFDDGVVKHGSSGSPILNQNKKVVGQLHGNDQYNSHQSYCLQPRAQYGKFNYSWTGGGTNLTRLSNWLDPVGTNQATINSCHPMGKIIGDNFICSYKEYYVDNLPSGYTVTWSLSDNYYNTHNCIMSNYPATNHCLIVRDQNHDLINATLTATIKYNNVVVKTLTKSKLYAYEGFRGSYVSGNISSSIDNTYILYVTPNVNTIITSPNFLGSTVSYSTTATIPLYWGWSPYTEELNVTMPANNNGIPIVIYIVDDCGNNYTLYLYPTSYNINVSNENNSITVTLNDNGDSKRSLSLDQPWTVEICDATTSELKTMRSLRSRSESISTVGWPKIIYVVKVTIGKEVMTEKVIIK